MAVAPRSRGQRANSWLARSTSDTKQNTQTQVAVAGRGRSAPQRSSPTTTTRTRPGAEAQIILREIARHAAPAPKVKERGRRRRRPRPSLPPRPHGRGGRGRGRPLIRLAPEMKSKWNGWNDGGAILLERRRFIWHLRDPTDLLRSVEAQKTIEQKFSAPLAPLLSFPRRRRRRRRQRAKLSSSPAENHEGGPIDSRERKTKHASWRRDATDVIFSLYY